MTDPSPGDHARELMHSCVLLQLPRVSCSGSIERGAPLSCRLVDAMLTRSDAIARGNQRVSSLIFDEVENQTLWLIAPYEANLNLVLTL